MENRTVYCKNDNLENNLYGLAKEYALQKPFLLTPLKGDGSDRRIYRIHFSEKTPNSIIGVTHTNLQENIDFQTVTFALKECDIAVPAFYQMDEKKECYLIEDLGEELLADLLGRWKNQKDEQQILHSYQKVLSNLKLIQIKATPKLYSFLSSRKMDESLYKKDLEFFRTNFLCCFDLVHFAGDPLWKELDEKLIFPLTQLKHETFVYRDFQSRNIMWKNSQPWFIDYQSAMLGNSLYDLASLLYASKSYLTDKQREHLLEYWFKLMEIHISYEKFLKSFYLVVLLRRLRSLGSYGFLSMKKGKSSFFQNIHPTLVELKFLFRYKTSLSNFPLLNALIDRVLESWSEDSERIFVA